MKRIPRVRAQIELDELLHGNPTMAQVADFWKNGEFYEEHYLVAAIKKHLLTEEQRICLFNLDLSIEDVLNGRIGGGSKWEFVTNVLFPDWNQKLGFESFKF